MTARRVLVLGGARSGKSALAERFARDSGGQRCYIATAEAFDTEMAERIARHRADRGRDWRTIEAPRALPEALAEAAADAGNVVLVDCLTLWLSNLMLDDVEVEAATDALLSALDGARAPVILVSNEVGMSIVPATPLGRSFRDAQGVLNARVAAAATDVFLVTAGLPLRLKPAAPAIVDWSATP